MTRETKDMVPVRLPRQAVEMLDDLIPVGLFGTSRGEVARTLILYRLAELAADGLVSVKTGADDAQAQDT